MLKIKNLKASVEKKQILKGLNLEIKAGEVHAIMGPNGSGKSTLANVLSGKKGYDIEGEILFDGFKLDQLSVEERAQKGIFLAFQYPVEIPGVNTNVFLRTALNSIRKSKGEKELDSVFVFCSHKLKEVPMFKNFIMNLDLWKNKKISCENRVSIVDILSKY